MSSFLSTKSESQKQDEGVASSNTYVRLTLVLGVLGILALTLFVASRPSRKVSSKTYTVERGTLDVKITGSGTLESSKNTEIKCQIRGGYGGRGGQSTVTWVIPSGSIVKKGDQLVRLDTKVIEETVSLGKTDTNIAKAALAQAEADLAKAKIAKKGYLDGRYRQQIQGLENQQKIAIRNLDRAKAMLTSSEALYQKGYVTKLEVESSQFAVRQAELELNVKETEIDVLSRLTKAMELESLDGQVIAATSRLEGRKAGLALEQGRLDLAQEEFERCIIKAPKDGLVIYPSTAKWKDSPDVTEGARVHNNQVLLLMPDLSQMQVKIGIHESIVEQLQAGMKARVRLPDRELVSEVSQVADVASPAGWWTGDQVQYDVTIRLPGDEGLNPGKTAEVEILAARHEDVLTVPVLGVVETEEGHFCWVESVDGPKRHALQLGSSNDEYVIVESGIKGGDNIVLDPTATVEEARKLVEPSLVHTIQRGDMQVTLTEQGTLESADNAKIKCLVRGDSTINWVIENGSTVKAGDVLVRIENKNIEEYLHERKKFAHLSQDAAIGFRTEATKAGIAISEYLEGQYRTQLLTLEKDLAILEANLRSSQNALEHAKMMAKDEYVTQLQLEQREFAVKQTKSTLEAKQQEIEVLKQFTKKEQLAKLRGDWESAKASASGHEEVLKMDNQRIELAQQEMARCIVKAERDGLVIYPKSEEWKNAPDIDEGATVHKDQVLLLMPDLTNMQVKVGIHESIIKSVKTGMMAKVILPDQQLEGTVSYVASVAQPAGWWSGNVVKYDALVDLPSVDGLKPGMSAEVRIILDELKGVLKIPKSAVVDGEDGNYCWVGKPGEASKRRVELGPGNDDFISIECGLEQGDHVISNPKSAD